MSDTLISAVLAAPAFLATVMYIVKRVAAFDLELRTHREEAQLRYLRASHRRRSVDHDLRVLQFPNEDLDVLWAVEELTRSPRFEGIRSAVDSKTLHGT